MSHPSDEELATIVDDKDAPALEVAAHVASCPACQKRVQTLQDVVVALRGGAQPSVVDDVMHRLQAPPWWSRWQLPSMAAAACAAVVGIVVWQAPADERDEMTPRGSAEHALSLQLLNNDRVLREGDQVMANSSWRADLLYAEGAAIGVVAIDAKGAVHWLRPTWTDAAQPPACPAPIVGARSVAPTTAAFVLPPGPLLVRAVRLPQPCDVPRLDEAFSHGTLAGAVVVDELHVTVQP